jgi:ribosomal-protein-alanine N-acetyltransferase
MKPIIRPMQYDDIAAVQRIEQQTYPYPWSERLFLDCLHPQYSSWLLYQTDITLGYLIMQPVVDECHLLNICVAKDHHHQGYGQQLMQHCLQFAQSQQAVSILLEVRTSNHVAKSLYQKWQFECIATRKNYYPSHEGREDAEVYRRVLSN